MAGRGGDYQSMKVATWHGGEKFTIGTAADPTPGPDQGNRVHRRK